MAGLEAVDPRYAALFARAQQVLGADPRVVRVEVAGSIAQGDADAWSDLDVHVYVRPDDHGAVAAEWPAWLAEITPTVFARTPTLPFIINTITADGLTFDVVVLPDGAPPFSPPTGYAVGLISGHRFTEQAEAVEYAVAELFRCLAGPFVTDNGRDEFIRPMTGCGHFLGLLTTVMYAESGAPPPSAKQTKRTPHRRPTHCTSGVATAPRDGRRRVRVQPRRGRRAHPAGPPPVRSVRLGMADQVGSGRTGASQRRGRNPMDLNADLGEGFGQWELTDDAALLEIVTSANVACGFHAGDPLRLERVLAQAAAAGIAVGAQVSYRDLAGFGRRFIDATPAELRADVRYQIGGLRGVASHPDQVRYVKPHGALYHACSTHPAQGDAVRAAAGDLLVLAAAGSPFLASLSERGVAEAFVDRAYNDDGTLVDRRIDGAVHHDPGQVVAQALQLALDHSVTTISGARLAIAATSLCVHGDTPGAAAMARRVRDALEDAGVVVASFA